MRPLQILMPMAGLGSRFAKAGYDTPKPLIPVDGQPMFLKAISSLNGLQVAKKYVFVIRQEHVDTLNLKQLIIDALPSANVVVIPKMTRGAAETALAAREQLDPESGVVIMDCDLYFRSEPYNQMVTESLDGTSDIAGGLLTFEADNSRYSYAEVDEDWMVTRTAEKVVISNRAITGAYYFATARQFVEAGDELLASPITDEMPEYYVSHLYNILLAKGGRIKATPVETFQSFGTPEELTAYESTKGISA